MIELGNFNLDECSFMLEMLVAAYVFSQASMKKREHFWRRFILAALLALIFSGFNHFSNLKFLLEAAVTGCVIYFSWSVSWQKAVYSVNCAYALQHFCFAVTIVIRCAVGVLTKTPVNIFYNSKYSMFFWIRMVIGYGGAYLLFSRTRKNREAYDVSTGQVTLYSTAVMFVVIVLSMPVRSYAATDEYILVMICYAYSMLCCIFIILLDDGIYRRFLLKNELGMIHLMWVKRQEQYITAKENIAAINRKCHELKRDIGKLAEMESLEQLKGSLEELREEIQIYDAVVKTGNEVLDVVLTERSMYCTAQHITLACVVDGSKIGFIDAADIYTIFANGMDIAIEQVSQIKNVKKRQIALSVWEKSGLLMIQIENYCGEEEIRELSGNGNTDLREISAQYDRNSIRYLIKKYGGYMTEHRENELFIVRISIPIPEVG